MAEDDYDDGDLDNTPDGTEDDDDGGNELRGLRRAAKAGAKAKAELKALQTKIAFQDAGVDMDSPVGKLFVKAYDGDITPAAIQAEAKAVNALRTDATLLGTTPGDAPNITPEEQAATQARNNLSSGAAPDQPITVDPKDLAMKLAKDSMGSGASWENAAAEYLEDRLWSASNDDKPIHWDAVNQRPVTQ